MKIRKSEERGLANHGWLKSRHTFSFANYYDPAHMGFRALRVINEDRVDGGGGFPPHPHRDMEIISYVLDGALEHQDSMGNGSVIRPGDVQRMSAGTGVVHSEYNHSPAEQVHFLQIWIQPDQRGVEPGYEQKHFTVEERKNALRVVASPDGRDGSVRIHQDASLAVALLDADHTVEHTIAEGRHAWVHVARGAVRLGDETLSAGDAAAFTEATTLSMTATEDAEVLVFDLA
ncbi:MAG: pirin family protein [Deltaproteobacteria bacterium]|jgi:redox-sensitive bicupin YhaK (pirin superfamily)